MTTSNVSSERCRIEIEFSPDMDFSFTNCREEISRRHCTQVDTLGANMPNPGSPTPQELHDRGVHTLYVVCGKCHRRGSYAVQGLIERVGPNCRLTDFLGLVASECPRRLTNNSADQCGARYHE
jgi:hypothetical protein